MNEQKLPFTFADIEKEVQELYARKDVEYVVLKGAIGTTIKLPVNPEKWPPAPGSDLDKWIRMSMNPFVIT